MTKLSWSELKLNITYWGAAFISTFFGSETCSNIQCPFVCTLTQPKLKRDRQFSEVSLWTPKIVNFNTFLSLHIIKCDNVEKWENSYEKWSKKSFNVKKNLLIKILLCLVEDSLVSTCDDDSTNDTIVKMATILVKIRTVVSTIMMLKWSWRGCISFSHSFILKINLFGEKIANHFSIQPLSCIATGTMVENRPKCLIVNFSILAFFTNFCPFEIGRSGNTVFR